MLLKIAAVGRTGNPRTRLDTIIVTPQDHIDDAADSIRPVNSRSAIRHDLDAVDGGKRNSGNIDPLPGRIIGHAAAVQNRECRIATKPAKIDGRASPDIAAGAGGHVETDPRILTAPKALRQAACDIAKIGQSRIADQLVIEHQDGRRYRCATNAAAGHNDPPTIIIVPRPARAMRSPDHEACPGPLGYQARAVNQPIECFLNREGTMQSCRSTILEQGCIRDDGPARFQRQIMNGGRQRLCRQIDLFWSACCASTMGALADSNPATRLPER